nr:PREDICTED: vitellogenin-2-like [Latimeria chalumnae]|eukprot:XP_014345682.1 PREDICTED: vitellogenin-2-like [Latimeria chalumnae]
MMTNAVREECTIARRTFRMFDHVKFKYSMPESCYHILVQDCRKEPKFMVQMKVIKRRKIISAVLASDEVQIELYDGAFRLLHNGHFIPQDQEHHNSSAGTFSVTRLFNGYLIQAPDLGLQKLQFLKELVKIVVGPKMKGKTCGICGHGDGEKTQAFKMPSGKVAKSPTSFAQSWLLREETCPANCKLTRKCVELGKTVRFEGKDSKCYSTEPVLRCLPECSPTKMITVKVGFHCVPSDSALSLDHHMDFDQQSEDIVDTVESHVACSCEDKCYST